MVFLGAKDEKFEFLWRGYFLREGIFWDKSEEGLTNFEQLPAKTCMVLQQLWQRKARFYGNKSLCNY